MLTCLLSDSTPYFLTYLFPFLLTCLLNWFSCLRPYSLTSLLTSCNNLLAHSLTCSLTYANCKVTRQIAYVFSINHEPPPRLSVNLHFPIQFRSASRLCDPFWKFSPSWSNPFFCRMFVEFPWLRSTPQLTINQRSYVISSVTSCLIFITRQKSG